MPTKLQKQHFARKILKLYGPSGDHWANGSMAFNRTRKYRGDNQDSVDACSKEAQSWCLMGAIVKLGLTGARPIPTTSASTSNSTTLLTKLDEAELAYKHWLATEIVHHTRFMSIPGFNDADGWRPIKAILTQLAKTGSIKGAKLPKSYLKQT